MSIFGAVVVFVIAWWLIFFMALPFGARPEQAPEEGHAARAPARPRLLLKAGVTTVLAALVTAGFGWALETGLIDWRPQDPLLGER
jgi:predicted secreted protein